MQNALAKELYSAYLDARKHKRNTINQLKFERNLETELLSLCREIETKTYELKPGICFINEIPVKREIIASDFRDRVVHHFLFNRINPILEKQFIYDSYSCRKGKGTLFGIKRVQGFLKSCYATVGANPCVCPKKDNLPENDVCNMKNIWVLRLDIQGFFMAINRQILYELIVKYVPQNTPIDNFLIQKIVFHDPLQNAVFKSPRAAWQGLPPDKSLMGSAPGCGLPIGNLTSQLFANVYLNPLDHFIKRNLKIKYYGRYVDDMVLIHRDKEVLLKAINQIKNFLSEQLHLTLHPKKIMLQSTDKGVPFLGAFIFYNNILPGKRVVENFRKCIFDPIDDENLQKAKVQSYLGLLTHFNTGYKNRQTPHH